MDHYANPIIAKYFEVIEDYTADFDFYDRLAKEGHRKFLDIGSGTGRIARRLGRQAVNVTGIEHSQAMIDQALGHSEHSSMSKFVNYVNEDARSFYLRESNFDVAFLAEYTFNALLETEDHIRCLQSIYNHLRVKGELVIHLFSPNPSYFAALPVGGIGGATWEFVGSFSLDDDATLLVSKANSYSRTTQTVHSDVVYEEVSASGVTRKFVSTVNTHAFTRSEIELLLRLTGFSEPHFFGDFEGGPLTDESWEMIVRCRKGIPNPSILAGTD